MNKETYLDNASTTQLSKNVLQAIYEFHSRRLANASSVHRLGVQAAKEVERVREQIAKNLGVSANEIIFTSGGTEANNLALKGSAWAHQEKGRHIIISSIEHSSILETAKWLGAHGFEISQIPVDKDGYYNHQAFVALLRPDTILVSVMHANNEVGTIQDVQKIAEVCKQRQIAFHTDACQSFGKVSLDLSRTPITILLS